MIEHAKRWVLPALVILVALLSASSLAVALTNAGPTGPTGAAGIMGATGPPGDTADISALQRQVDKLTAFKESADACIPEYVNYVQGASVETSYESMGDSPDWLTSAYLTFGTQVDSNCSKWLGLSSGFGD